MTPTACQLIVCLFFTRLRGSCCPSCDVVKHIACFVLGSMLSWGREICWRGWWRVWMQVCSSIWVFIGSPDSWPVLQRDRGFVSGATSDIFASAFSCSEYLRGAPSAWPTWKYGYRRAWNTNQGKKRSLQLQNKSADKDHGNKKMSSYDMEYYVR